MRATHLAFWSPALWLLTAMLPACGGDSGSGGTSAAQVQQTCLNVCNKEKECTPSFPLKCSDVCNPMNGAGGSTATSTGTANCDYNELMKKENDCVSKSCSEFTSCLMDATSICSGNKGSGASTGAGGSSSGAGASTGSGATTGAGGSDGSGASTGSGGSSSGTADCSVCDQAAACCMKAGGGPSCSSLSKASCDMEPTTLKATVAGACQQALDGFKSAGGC